MCNIELNSEDSFIKLIEKSIKDNWYQKALTDYKGATFQYRDVARKIEKVHIVFEYAGIKKGDKIALCSKNCANWSTMFLAAITYGAVAVPILHEFKPDQIHNIINHSEAKILLASNQIWESLNEEFIPKVEGIFCSNDFELLFSRSEKLTYAKDHLNELFCKRFPCRFEKEDIAYSYENNLNELAVINYTSGTTGFSKGVMLPYRSLLSNVLCCHEKIGINSGDNIVSMLPMGHVFGMVFDFLYGFSQGAHIWFLTRIPSPKIITESFNEIRPRIISSVPLIVEKIFKKNILPTIDNRLGNVLLHIPIVNDKIKAKILKKSKEVFGNNFIEIIIGGAPFNADVEAFVRSINFPYTIVYGMTECGPIICHSHWSELKQKSCGKTGARMTTKIVSDNPYKIPGELLCKGDNLMIGYYKNSEATAQVIDKEGWLHTGDMAIKDEEDNIYIKGRCKNMLLTASGQNIYPEEIEAKLNNMPIVSESLIIMKQDKLVALVYPDAEDAYGNGLSKDEIYKIIEQNRIDLNKTLPLYSQISSFKLYPEEFEKTAKKSIKRYLYQ